MPGVISRISGSVGVISRWPASGPGASKRSDTPPAPLPLDFFSSSWCNGYARHHLNKAVVPVRGDQSWHSEEQTKMKIPVWLKPGLWGAAIGAVAMAIVGFSQLG